MRRAAIGAAVALVGACSPPDAVPPPPEPVTAPPAPDPAPTTAPTSPPSPVPSTPAATVVTAARTAAVSPPTAPPVHAPGAGGGGGDVWARLAACESGTTNLHGPRYFGFHSWLLATWRAAGGTGRPDDHTYAEQVAVAEAWLARTSWAQWPACSRALGLR